MITGLLCVQVTGQKRPASSAHGGMGFFRGPALAPPSGNARFGVLRGGPSAAAGAKEDHAPCDGSVRGPKSARLAGGLAMAVVAATPTKKPTANRKSACAASCGDLAGAEGRVKGARPSAAAGVLRQRWPLLPQGRAPAALETALETEQGGRRGSAGLYKVRLEPALSKNFGMRRGLRASGVKATSFLNWF